MDGSAASPWLWVRIALVGFVLAWIIGPSALRGAVPILVVFLVALGLEIHFLVSALRHGGPRRRPDRRPQEVDLERYGFEEDEPGEDDPEEYASSPSLVPVRRFVLGLGLMVALLGAIWFVQSRTGWDALSGETKASAVARFSAEASRVAEKPVSIRCDEARDYVGAVQHADGVATVGGDLGILTPEICNDLYRQAFKGDTTGARTGRAIAVLAHEAWHLRGTGDEGTTECYALQSGVELGTRLGLSEDTARQLMRQQLIENQLRGASTLEYRVPPECRNGGRLDLDRVVFDFREHGTSPDTRRQRPGYFLTEPDSVVTAPADCEASADCLLSARPEIPCTPSRSCGRTRSATTPRASGCDRQRRRHDAPTRRATSATRTLRLPTRVQMGGTGLEPVTPSLSSWCSPN